MWSLLLEYAIRSSVFPHLPLSALTTTFLFFSEKIGRPRAQGLQLQGHSLLKAAGRPEAKRRGMGSWVMAPFAFL